jgi:hypothetical protein
MFLSDLQTAGFWSLENATFIADTETSAKAFLSHPYRAQ